MALLRRRPDGFFNVPPLSGSRGTGGADAVAMRQHMDELAEKWRRGHQLGSGRRPGYATWIGFESRVDYGAMGPVTNRHRLCDKAQVDGPDRSAFYAAVEKLVKAESGRLPLGGSVSRAFNVVRRGQDEQMAILMRYNSCDRRDKRRR